MRIPSFCLFGAVMAVYGAVIPLGPSWAGPSSVYEFVPAPHTKLNRVYRVDRTTGEVIACQYALWTDTVGATQCFPSGEGASAQSVGEYGLIASRHEAEGGVFRVNYRTGDMSICYVLESEKKVVCTAQSSTVGMGRVEKPQTPLMPADAGNEPNHSGETQPAR